MSPEFICILLIRFERRLQDNPLHIALFPPYSDAMIEFSFLLNSCLDIFEIRRKQTSIDQDLGLLHAIDERLAAYGWLTTTGVKLLVIVDLFGPEATSARLVGPAVSGLRDSDLKPVCCSLYPYVPKHGLTFSD